MDLGHILKHINFDKCLYIQWNIALIKYENSGVYNKLCSAIFFIKSMRFPKLLLYTCSVLEFKVDSNGISEFFPKIDFPVCSDLEF